MVQRAPERVQQGTGTPQPFDTIPPLRPAAPGNPLSTFCFYDFDDFRYFLLGESDSICPLGTSFWGLTSGLPLVRRPVIGTQRPGSP